MAKNLKLTIKNTQIAEAINLNALKSKLAAKKSATEEETVKAKAPPVKTSAKAPKAEKANSAKPETSKVEAVEVGTKESKEEAPKIRARTRSAFAEPIPGEFKAPTEHEEIEITPVETEQSLFEVEETTHVEENTDEPKRKTSEQLRKDVFGDDAEIAPATQTPVFSSPFQSEAQTEAVVKKNQPKVDTPTPRPRPQTDTSGRELRALPPIKAPMRNPHAPTHDFVTPPQRLGPTGRHVKDLIPPPRPAPVREERPNPSNPAKAQVPDSESESARKARTKVKGKEPVAAPATEDDKKNSAKVAKFKEFRDIKPTKRTTPQTRFDGRDRQGLRESDDDQHWRKRRPKAGRHVQEDPTIRPTTLAVRIPIALKDLAVEMKLKSSQLIGKLFQQGMIVTLNDILDNETAIQLLGHEFGCEITIDTREEQRIRITDKTIKEEIKETDPSVLTYRPPVVAFMGHVDHGKTSLIDAIRKSNRAAGEAGAITQHIGAFRCSTAVGDIAILDTPGHEAFSAMRARGADVTDIVVLVIAGDEGMRQQTIEALQHAKAANVTIVVAINKSDKPNFNADNVYRQLSENELLPEVWGGQTITVNCSAVTGEGIPQLLEMLALQAEVLELKAAPTSRARGTVLESEMHKGMGPIATVLVQNGTLRCGDALVFGQLWGRVKTMRDEFRHDLLEAGPSTPVEITGVSGLPEAGQEFIVVKNEKEAKEIADARMLGMRQVNLNLLQTKKLSMDNLFQQAAETNKKILNIVLRADVQGSLEALKAALMKIESTKADLNIIFTGVGEVSESDIQLGAASKAVIIGFHTQIESHADPLIKELGVQVRLHNIIYHAIDDVKVLMGGLLDKLAQETEKGKAEVKATFKSSQHGIIAGCIVTEGSITRNNSIRVRRNNEIVWKGTISSLKRIKEDVREVAKGLECGILLNNYNELVEGDILEAYEVTYITQQL